MALSISPIAFKAVSPPSSPAITLEDRSLWQRAGLKGAKATDWMRENGLPIPEINAALLSDNGWLIARLAPNEYAALASTPLETSGPPPLPAYRMSGDNEPGLCPVLRSAANAWFRISGPASATMFSKICGVDLSPKSFANGRIAQTIVARSSAIVIRDDAGDTLAFHVLMDWASADYLWGALTDAAAEFCRN